MAAPIRVRVITPDRVVFDGDATSIQYPGEDGLYGILPGHASMITTVDAGFVRLRLSSSDQERIFVSRGFAQVAKNEVRFAVDSGECEEEIDLERARKAVERARERLGKRRQEKVDYLRAEYALRRALMRLRAKGQRH